MTAALIEEARRLTWPHDTPHDAERAKVIEALCDALEAATSWTDEDRPLPEDELIRSAHPMRAGMIQTGTHERYADAMRMVSAKRSKGALVDLVNWLLFQAADADEMRNEALKHHGEMVEEMFTARAERDAAKAEVALLREALDALYICTMGDSHMVTSKRLSAAMKLGEQVHDAMRIEDDDEEPKR